MSKIIRERRVELRSEFTAFWTFEGKTSGYAFDCDRNGKIDETHLARSARENLRACRKGEMECGQWLPIPRGEKPKEGDKDFHDVGWCRWHSEGVKRLIGPEVSERVIRLIHPAITVCDCGHHHSLVDNNQMGDSQCKCGQWYNAVGQQLIPPTQWGEDTGERFDDEGRYVSGGCN